MGIFNPIPGGLGGGLPIFLLWSAPISMSLYAGLKASQWYGEYKSLPEDSDISSWPWYKKIVIGWMDKADAFIGGIIQNANQKAREDRQVFASGDLGQIASHILGYLLPIMVPIVGVRDIAVGTVNWLGQEWNRDKWDFAWKAVGITAGIIATIAGILASPVTGGGSLVLTAAGVTMVASAVAVGAKESYEYTMAETKDELEAYAKDDVDEIIYVPTTAIGGYYTSRIGMASYLVKRDPDFYIHSKQHMIAPSGKRVTHVAVVRERGYNVVIDTAATDGRYYIENSYYKNALSGKGKLGLEAHEAYGEAAIERGIVKLPLEVESLDKASEMYAILRDIAADKAAARFVGREALVQSSGYDWWNPSSVELFLPSTITRVYQNTEIPAWYSPLTPIFTSAGNVMAGQVSTGSENVTGNPQ